MPPFDSALAIEDSRSSWFKLMLVDNDTIYIHIHRVFEEEGALQPTESEKLRRTRSFCSTSSRQATIPRASVTFQHSPRTLLFK